MDYKKRKIIGELYKRFVPQMLEGKRFSPYRFSEDGWLDMTKIEFNVWEDIRCLGLPFYPQFPVLEYFVDFADPVKKIVIEVDGKEWHLDKEKDDYRQKRIEDDGWFVIRIQGKDTYRCLQTIENDSAYDEEREPEKVGCICSYCKLKKLKFYAYEN